MRFIADLVIAHDDLPVVVSGLINERGLRNCMGMRRVCVRRVRVGSCVLVEKLMLILHLRVVRGTVRLCRLLINLVSMSMVLLLLLLLLAQRR